MRIRLKKIQALLLVQIAACWPVWQWYARRLFTSSPNSTDEQWGLLAALTAIALLIWHPGEKEKERSATTMKERAATISSEAATLQLPSLLIPSLLMLLYAASFHFLPPIFRAAIAFTAIGITLAVLSRRRFTLAVWALLLLALPVIPSLQFYLGYPLRVIVGALTAPLLQLSGLAVMREGTCLNWGGQLIAIDAPCSGVRMLWTSFYLVFTLACVLRLNAWKTVLAVLLALPVIVAGNVLRASALFYLEAKILTLPVLISGETIHAGVGVVAFALTAVAIVRLIRRINAPPDVETLPV